MGLNIRGSFEAVLRKYGHDIFLQRVTNPYKANEKLSYSMKLERHTVRHMYPRGSQGASLELEEQSEGLKWDVDMVYYFSRDVNPTSGDRIYDNIDRYPNGTATYIIDFAIPMRGKAGLVAFWEVGAKRETPE